MAIRFEKFTAKSQEAVQRAQELAQSGGHPQMTAVHLLAALLAERAGVVDAVLEKIAADRRQLDQIVEAELKHLPKVSGGNDLPQPAPDCVQVLEAAQRESDGMRDEFVSIEHLLLALAKTDSKAQKILKLNAIDENDVLNAVKAIRGSTRVTDPHPEDKFQALENTASI